MIDNRNVGRRIAYLRQSRSLTQQQLAAIIGVSHQAVSKWEGGAALPDLQSMLTLTRFFGITMEGLIVEEAANDSSGAPQAVSADAQTSDDPNGHEEVDSMNIQQLLQMAPYMSKETVEEISMGLETRLSAAQIAKLAPYVRPECLEALINKHRPELSWDALRKMAPFMSKEAVDKLARAVADGKEAVKPAAECINKTFDDIGKAFDGIGKGIGQAFDGIGKDVGRTVQKAIRFGGNVINEVSTAFSDLSSEPDAAPAGFRSDKAVSLRKKAFERAMDDGKWAWIGEHIGEINSDEELKSRIAAKAKELGMHDWICEYMGGYADEFTIAAAIANGNWSWLGDNAWQLEEPMQEKVALAAMRAENWQWLGRYADQLNLKNCGGEIAETALNSGATVLAAQLAKTQLSAEQTGNLAQICFDKGDFDALDLLIESAGDFVDRMLPELAAKGDWQGAQRYIKLAKIDTVEKLMELALDQGNFDAVDMLDAYL